MSSGKSICPVPDILFYDRENRRRRRLHNRQKVELVIINTSDIDKFIIRCTTDMLSEGMISIRFTDFPNKKTLNYKLNWPWNFANDFNELPSYIRSKISDKHFKGVCKQYFSKKHPHVMQKLHCGPACMEDRITLPPDALDFNRIKLNDDEDNVKAKARLRLEAEIFTVTDEEKSVKIFNSARGGLPASSWLTDINKFFWDYDKTIFETLKRLWLKHNQHSKLFTKNLAHNINHMTHT